MEDTALSQSEVRLMEPVEELRLGALLENLVLGTLRLNEPLIAGTEFAVGAVEFDGANPTEPLYAKLLSEWRSSCVQQTVFAWHPDHGLVQLGMDDALFATLMDRFDGDLLEARMVDACGSMVFLALIDDVGVLLSTPQKIESVLGVTADESWRIVCAAAEKINDRSHIEFCESHSWAFGCSTDS